MKIVVRKGVFETNSSSTHSLSIKKVDKDSPNKIDDEASFEIRSPLAKIVLLYGLMENAEEQLSISGNMLDNNESNIDEAKVKIIAKIKRLAPELLNGVNEQQISSCELANIVYKLDSLEEFKCFFNEEDYMVSNYFDIDIESKRQLNIFKTIVFDEYCKMTGKSSEEAQREIDKEAFGNCPDDEKCYSCHRYFCNGSLDECNCGFESYYDICYQLKIESTTSKEQLRTIAKQFLSDECKIVARECLGYTYFIRSGEIY